MYAEFGEDQWIVDNLKLPESGIYVEVGAASPTDRSNTAFLRDRGWTGLAIDGDEYWEPFWQGVQGATFIRQIIHTSPEVNFGRCAAAPVLSRIDPNGAPTDHTSTLCDLMDIHGITQVDFLSLDCEGQEYEVFLSAGLNFRPTIIIAEFNTAGIGEDLRLKAHLEHIGYETVHQTIANFIYVRR